MKKYNSIYLGICINNNDPQKRGRVQVFIPHVMPALYEGWNAEGKDINLSCVGDNIPDGLSSDIVERLKKILPWAESASPILGISAPGNVLSTVGGAIGGALGAAVAGPLGGSIGAAAGAAAGSAAANLLDQSPVSYPPVGSQSALFQEAGKYNTSGVNASKFSRKSSPDGKCGIGARSIIGAMTNNSYFKNGLSAGGGGSLSFAASSLSKGNDYLQKSGLYQGKQPMPGNYISDKSQWQIGDVITSGGGKKGYGHIQVWTGCSWVSDFDQGSKVLPAGSGPYNNFVLHRANPKGQSIMNQRVAQLAKECAGQVSETTSSSGEVAAASPHAAPIPTNFQEAPSPSSGSVNQASYANIANPQTSLNAVPNFSLSLTTQQQGAVNSFLGNYKNNLSQYQAVSNNLKAQGINMSPSQVAALQWREASGDLTKSIANGQKLGTNVRKDGRLGQGSGSGAFTNTNNWVQNATEVLSYKVKEKYGTSTKDFGSQAQFNDFAERFNGLGYRKKGRVSPYVYSGTNLYTGGKYVADGKYDPNVKDKQVGTAVLVSVADENIDPSQFPPVPDVPGEVNQGELATDTPEQPPNLINNTDPHGTTVTQNINNMAKGVFAFPAAGAMLWCFFREGNPLHPVYFAASYSASEWQSAYRQGSDAPGIAPAPNPETGATSVGSVINWGVGGIRVEDTNSPTDRTKDHKSLCLYGYDGSNMFFDNGYHQIFSKFDRRDQVEGDRWETTLGFKEEWVQGDSNEVCMGDVFIKIGNVSAPAVDAVTRIQEIIKEIQAPLTETSSS